LQVVFATDVELKFHWAQAGEEATMHLNQISCQQAVITTNAYSSNFIGYFAGYSNKC
jgi:hypothetical protein